MARLSQLAPSFDAIRERLLAFPRQPPAIAGALVVSLMSRVGGEGVTTIAVGLARALARTGSLGTLLINYDTRRQGAAAWLGVQPRPLLGWAADSGERTLTDAVHEVEPGQLGLLSLGDNMPSGFASDGRWRPAFAHLCSSFDVVLVDAGSCRQPLALRWARLAELRLLVVDTGRTTVEELQRLKVEWQSHGHTLDAVVLSKRDYSVPGFLYRHVR